MAMAKTEADFGAYCDSWASSAGIAKEYYATTPCTVASQAELFASPAEEKVLAAKLIENFAEKNQDTFSEMGKAKIVVNMDSDTTSIIYNYVPEAQEPYKVVQYSWIETGSQEPFEVFVDYSELVAPKHKKKLKLGKKLETKPKAKPIKKTLIVPPPDQFVSTFVRPEPIKEWKIVRTKDKESFHLAVNDATGKDVVFCYLVTVDIEEELSPQDVGTIFTYWRNEICQDCMNMAKSVAEIVGDKETLQKILALKE